MLFQYGFFVPAGRAKIMIMSGILFSFTDEQNQLQGLSSFAAEMKKIDEIIEKLEKYNKEKESLDIRNEYADMRYRRKKSKPKIKIRRKGRQ